MEKENNVHSSDNENRDRNKNRIEVDASHYEMIQRIAISKEIEDKVAGSLKKRYTILGMFIAIVSLFGGYTLLTTSISSVVKEPLRKEIDAAQSERIQLLELRKEVELQIENLEEATRKANAAAEKAAESADVAQRRIVNFLEEVDDKFEMVEEKFVLQTDKLTENERKVSDISSKAETIQNGLEEKSNEILDAYRRVGENEKILSLEVAKIGLINDALWDMVSFLGRSSGSNAADTKLSGVSSSIAEANEQFQENVNNLSAKWSYNVIVYSQKESMMTDTIKAVLDDAGFRPTVWITPLAKNTEDSAMEISREFGVSTDLLLNTRFGIIATDNQSNKVTSDEIKKVISPFISSDFHVSFQPLEPAGMHKVFLGKEYANDKIMLIYLLP